MHTPVLEQGRNKPPYISPFPDIETLELYALGYPYISIHIYGHNGNIELRIWGMIYSISTNATKWLVPPFDGGIL